ncbi:hypothetical protein BaRGS_00026048, partial [Batillaria attramentaria]
LDQEVRQCFRQMGWPYNPYPSNNYVNHYNYGGGGSRWGGRGFWFFDDRRRQLANTVGDNSLQFLHKKHQWLMQESVRCQEALAARTPAPPPRFIEMERRLQQRIDELGRLLRQCLRLGGFSFLRVAKKKRETAQQRIEMLQSTKLLFEAEVANCFKGIGRLPNGDPTPTPNNGFPSMDCLLPCSLGLRSPDSSLSEDSDENQVTTTAAPETTMTPDCEDSGSGRSCAVPDCPPQDQLPQFPCPLTPFTCCQVGQEVMQAAQRAMH